MSGYVVGKVVFMQPVKRQEQDVFDGSLLSRSDGAGHSSYAEQSDAHSGGDSDVAT